MEHDPCVTHEGATAGPMGGQGLPEDVAMSLGRGLQASESHMSLGGQQGPWRVLARICSS